MLLEISQNSQENTCARVFFNHAAGLRSATLLETQAQVFSCIFCEISKNTFFREHLLATASKFIFSIEIYLKEFLIFLFLFSRSDPLHTGRKLRVHKTFLRFLQFTFCVFWVHGEPLMWSRYNLEWESCVQKKDTPRVTIRT